MTITIRPDLEGALRAQLSAGTFVTADELVNAVLDQYITDDFQAGELDRLLAVGVQQAAAGQFIEESDVIDRIAQLSESRRNGK